MTVFWPTTTVRIERGDDTDEYGDPIDSDTVYASALPATITEISQRSFRAAEQRGGSVEEFTVRLRPSSPLQEGDRVIDERTEAVYQIRSVRHSPTVVGIADVIATAVQISKVSVP